MPVDFDGLSVRVPWASPPPRQLQNNVKVWQAYSRGSYGKAVGRPHYFVRVTDYAKRPKNDEKAVMAAMRSEIRREHRIWPIYRVSEGTIGPHEFPIFNGSAVDQSERNRGPQIMYFVQAAFFRHKKLYEVAFCSPDDRRVENFMFSLRDLTFRDDSELITTEAVPTTVEGEYSIGCDLDVQTPIVPVVNPQLWKPPLTTFQGSAGDPQKEGCFITLLNFSAEDFPGDERLIQNIVLQVFGLPDDARKARYWSPHSMQGYDADTGGSVLLTYKDLTITGSYRRIRGQAAILLSANGAGVPSKFKVVVRRKAWDVLYR